MPDAQSNNEWIAASPCRVLVTGSRDWTDLELVFAVLRERGSNQHTLVHGGAKGVDTIVDQAWRRLYPRSPVEVHLADWDRFGRSAGFVRNAEMVAAGADLCLAFILNGSSGATHCATLARQASIPTVIYRRDDDATQQGEEM